MVFEKIKKFIVDQLDVEPEKVTLDTNIMTDLSADSLDAVEVLAQIEEEFGIEIPDDATEDFNVIKNLVKYVEDHI